MLKFFLYPFSLLYGFGVYIRNRMYDLNILQSKEFDVPVISIGNITVGGTGKTPHVEYLIKLLKDKFRVATLSRGYKRKTKGFLRVETDTHFSKVGDEPLQIKNKFSDVLVSVCENRVKGVENLIQNREAKPDVIILDDAFQHRRITAGINILLIDYNRQISEDTLLPAGRLRESARQMRRANVIIFTKCPGEVTPIMRRILQKEVKLKPYQELYFTTYEYDEIAPVFSAPKLNNDFYSEHSWSILIVTGIAFPKLIPMYLKKFSYETDVINFPDHHNYTKSDLNLIMKKFRSLKNEKKVIITTEKDAVRLKGMSDLGDDIKNVLYYLPVKVKFLDSEGKLFDNKILNYVGENKSNRELRERTNRRQS